MIYLAEFHWGWLLGAVLIGLATGWVGLVHRGRGLSRQGLLRAAIAFAVLIGLAVARLVPGRFGYWLDLGVVMLLVYLGGCATGAWLRGLLIERHTAT